MKSFQIVLLTVLLRNVTAGLFTKRVAKVDVFKECDDIPNYQNLTFRYVNTTLITDATRRTYINTTYLTTRDIERSSVITGFIKLTRCKNRESPDTCESFTNLRVPNIMSAMNMKGQFWSTFTNNINPPFLPSMKKGVYEITNGYFDADSTPFPVPDRTYWKARIESFLRNDQLQCFYIEGCLIKMKKDL